MRFLTLLVAAPLVVLAIIAPSGELTVVERVAVDSPLTICNRWRPHGSGDHVYTADTYKMTIYYVDTQCIASHPGANHYYCVTTWWNDAETWRHPCFDGL